MKLRLTDYIHQLETILYTRQAWSRQKRIIVAAAATGVVLLVAFASGSILYGITRLLGWTETQSIKKLAMKEALSDEAFLKASEQALTQRGCANTDSGYQLLLTPPLKQIDETGSPACAKFGLVGSTGTDAFILISMRTEAKEEVIRQIVASVTKPETNSLPQAQWETTFISGQREKKPYQAYVLARTTEKTLLVEYYPADPAGMPAVKELVKSIRER